jgi:hypothetical protein
VIAVLVNLFFLRILKLNYDSSLINILSSYKFSGRVVVSFRKTHFITSPFHCLAYCFSTKFICSVATAVNIA